MTLQTISWVAYDLWRVTHLISARAQKVTMTHAADNAAMVAAALGNGLAEEGPGTVRGLAARADALPMGP